MQNRFGSSIRITTFSDGESCLEKIDAGTNIVLLDYYLNGKNGLEILKSIKAINPKTEVIMLSSNKDISLAIETFKAGAVDYIVKNNGLKKKVSIDEPHYYKSYQNEREDVWLSKTQLVLKTEKPAGTH